MPYANSYNEKTTPKPQLALGVNDNDFTRRSIGHQLEHQADAHVLVAFLAYGLQVTLKNRLMMHAPGLTPAAVFEKLGSRCGFP
jgi:hypothetical protein